MVNADPLMAKIVPDVWAVGGAGLAELPPAGVDEPVVDEVVVDLEPAFDESVELLVVEPLLAVDLLFVLLVVDDLLFALDVVPVELLLVELFAGEPPRPAPPEGAVVPVVDAPPVEEPAASAA